MQCYSYYGRLHVFYDPATDPTDALVELSVQNRWGLYELQPQRASLEDIFVHITTEEQESPKGTAA